MKIAARLIPATFVKRDNRFRLTVRVAFHPAWTHLPNSGRLRELLVPGRRVLLTAAQAPGRLTSYDLLMVDLDGTLGSIILTLFCFSHIYDRTPPERAVLTTQGGFAFGPQAKRA